MFKEHLAELMHQIRDFKRGFEAFPEGPKDFMVYHGPYNIPFATNGKVWVCWVPPKVEKNKETMPGFWSVVGSRHKVLLDGTILECTPEECEQKANTQY